MPDALHTQSQIHYTLGDATQPSGRPAIIAHICNDLGAWGRGFVLAVSRRWPDVADHYRRWLAWQRAGNTPALGAVQIIEVEPHLWVANVIAQHGIRTSLSGLPPIRYDALTQCLSHVQVFAVQHQASVHMPRIGCGLAGGTWDRVEPIIIEALCAHGIAVTVYDLPSRNAPACH